MSTILDKIAASTRVRVAVESAGTSLAEMKRRAANAPARQSFAGALAAPGMAFICEVKKASPSKGVIAQDFDPVAIAREYAEAGAAAISVLTEPEYFLGSPAYLADIAAAVPTPLLRKDFVVDEYQIYGAKALGASAVLLICAILDDGELARFLYLAGSLGLDALVETHDEAELEHALAAGAKIIGVNNRDLHTFEVDTANSLRLRALAPPEVLFVSESGISTAGDIAKLSAAGVNAVLVGEALMRSADKAAALVALRGEL